MEPVVTVILTAEEVERQFSAAIEENDWGEHHIPADGDWHNFAFPGDRPGEKKGSAKLTFGDPIEGVVKDFRRPGELLLVWQPDGRADFSTRARPRRDDAAAKARAEEVRLKLLNFYVSLPDAPADHPYLVAKGIRHPYPLKLDGEALVVPVFDARSRDRFQTFQRIWARGSTEYPEGKKMFAEGGKAKGGCVIPGRRALDDLSDTHGAILIAEGYATAHSIQSATCLPTVAALSCGNFVDVAVALRRRFPLHPITIAADAPNEKGTDYAFAVKAAQAIGAKIATPTRKDFNDVFRTDGAEKVEALIKAAVDPPPPTSAPPPPPPSDAAAPDEDAQDAQERRGPQQQSAQQQSAQQQSAQQSAQPGAQPGGGPQPRQQSGRPIILVASGKLSDVVAEAEAALVEAGAPFYERSNRLVRPIVKTVDTFHGGKTVTALFAPVDAPYMRNALSRAAAWKRFDARGTRWVDIDPPTDVAPIILSSAGDWKFRTVAGIVTTQTMRPDGSILSRPGYDEATQLLLIDPPPMPAIPDRPTRDDAVAALNLLDGLLDEFSFVDDAARSTALSGIITPVVRGAFLVAPMLVVDAPDAGAGKSYLLHLASVVATGQHMPVVAAGRDEEETEKRLGAALLAGQPLITLDNVSNDLRGDALCQIIEQPRPQVRVLGRSELVTIDTRGTTLFANGNNIVVAGDLYRRVIRVRLDPKMERPELREFKGNPIAKVAANRGDYVAAALIICRAYAAAGRPGLLKPLVSFDGWSNTVRSALAWLGRRDPVDTVDASRRDDPDRTLLRDMLAAWGQVIGVGDAHRKTLREAIATAEKTDPAGAGQVVLRWPDFNAAVRAAAKSTTRRDVDVSALGQWMKRNKDRRLGGRYFAHHVGAQEVSTWCVVDETGATADGLEDDRM